MAAVVRCCFGTKGFCRKQRDYVRECGRKRVWVECECGCLKKCRCCQGLINAGMGHLFRQEQGLAAKPQGTPTAVPSNQL